MAYELPGDWKDIFRTHVQKIVAKGDQYIGICPFHEDKRPSFSINGLTSQWICFAGCGKGNYWDFKRFIEDPSRIVRIAPQIEPQAQKQPIQETLVETYQYMHKNGDIVFEVSRYEPKNFRQRKYGGYDMKGVDRIPYHHYDLHLPERKDEVLFWVEGEKDADSLSPLAILSSTSPGGANGWADSLADEVPQDCVVMIPDQDFPGCLYSQNVTKSFIKRNKTVLIWDVPQPSKDISDFLKSNPIVKHWELKNKIWEEGNFSFSTESPKQYFFKNNIPVDKWDGIGTKRLDFLRKQYKTVSNLIEDGINGPHLSKIINLIDEQVKATRDEPTYDQFCQLLKYLHLLKGFHAKFYK